MNYYFLAASLPTLALDAAPPFSVAEFRRTCAEHLSGGDLKALDGLLGPAETARGSAFADEWRERDAALRNALAAARAERLKVDPEPWLRPCARYDTSAQRAAGEAMSRKDPRERERLLDRLRWLAAEEMAGFDMFAPRAIFAYAVKLQLAARWNLLDEDAGHERARRIIDQEPESKRADARTDESDTESEP